MKNFVVKCPKDWATNVKWSEIIEALNKINGDSFEGCIVDDYYTHKNGEVSNRNFNKFNLPELSIDQAHAVLCGIDWSCAGVEVVSSLTSAVIKIDGYCNDINFSGTIIKAGNSGDFVGTVSASYVKEYFTPYIPDSESIEPEIKELENEIQYTIYQQLRVLGFKKERLQVENEFGYKEFVMRKKICENRYFEWRSSMPELDCVDVIFKDEKQHSTSVELVRETLKNLGK